MRQGDKGNMYRKRIVELAEAYLRYRRRFYGFPSSRRYELSKEDSYVAGSNFYYVFRKRWVSKRSSKPRTRKGRQESLPSRVTFKMPLPVLESFSDAKQLGAWSAVVIVESGRYAEITEGITYVRDIPRYINGPTLSQITKLLFPNSRHALVFPTKALRRWCKEMDISQKQVKERPWDVLLHSFIADSRAVIAFVDFVLDVALSGFRRPTGKAGWACSEDVAEMLLIPVMKSYAQFLAAEQWKWWDRWKELWRQDKTP